MKYTNLILALFLSFASITVATAQDAKAQDFATKQVSELTKKLSLDADQVEKVKTIVADTEAQKKDVKATLLELREQKANLDSSNKDDVAKFNSDYKAAQDELSSIEEKKNNAITEVLNDDQKATFKEMTTVNKAAKPGMKK